MDPLKQEAESRKYSNDVIMLLPLSGGQWAVMDAKRAVRFIGPEHHLHDFVDVVRKNPPESKPEPVRTHAIDLGDIKI